MTDRPRVAIAHDYLTQRGGAERVVLAMARAFPDAPIYTTLYDPDGTYPEFRDRTIVTSSLNRVGLFRRDHRAALPLLAPASSRLRVDADVVVASSSGWAHGFATTGKKLVYCHAPARWIYQSETYLGGPLTASPQGWALFGLRAPLRRWDRQAAASADVYLANSRVVAKRIQEAYALEARVVPPPHGVDTAGPLEPVPSVASWAAHGYALVVSRLLPYKNVDVAVEALNRRKERLLVIGDGPMYDELAARSSELLRVERGLSDAQMRWAYRHARVLVATSHEDFGLTPLEASAFGVPTVALHAGGYLDTISPGLNGIFFSEPDPVAIAAALGEAVQIAWDSAAIQAHADRFAEPRFHDELQREVKKLVGAPRE